MAARPTPRRRPARRARRLLAGRATAFAALLLALATFPATPPAQGEPLDPDLLQQIGALQQEKAQRSPAQRKVSSQLLYEARMRAGLPVAPGVPQVYTNVEVDGAGRVLLDLRADPSEALRDEIEALGGVVVSAFPRWRTLRVQLPLAAVELLAARPDVQRIRPADRAYTRKLNTSQGDGAHHANTARASFDVDGTGITVGVLSDGVDALATVQSSGDLPAGVTVLPGEAGSGTEGTAMLEIVYDLAPGASLLFATAFGSQASFASNILALRAAGADVIVDDVGYFAEAVFQDDDIAAAVDQVVADGAMYFSAAGNGGNWNDGTSGVWEGNFVPGPSVNGDPAHDYGAGDITNEITGGSPYVYTLHWADPLGSSANDYDLYLTNKPGNVILAASTDVQAGTGDPYEQIGATPSDTGRQLIVVRSAGAARFLHLNTNRGQLEHATPGQTSGHPAARGAFGVAAVDARGKTLGFTGSEPVETFSSDGPRRVFFEADGTPITPGDFSSSGGELRQKPDLAGADCVTTATSGFSTFCGTSAAAPHAAAIAALLLEQLGGPGAANAALVGAAMTDTAIDIEGTGFDRDSGAGIVQANAAGASLVPECTSDSQCNDFQLCNGTEVCDAGTCVAGTPFVCPEPVPYCDATLNACVACLADADCADALYCNGDETCQAGACVEGTPPVCDLATPLCDEVTDVCVACLADADCADPLYCNGDETCQAGACTAGTPPVCDAATPYCDESNDVCVACLAGSDCDSGLCEAGVCLPPQIPAGPSGPGAALLGGALLLAGLGALAARRRRPSRGAAAE